MAPPSDTGVSMRMTAERQLRVAVAVAVAHLAAAAQHGHQLQAAPAPPVHGCMPPHANESFCDTSLTAAKRAELVVAQLTVPELIGMMQGDQPAVERLGVPAYHYGYEALHGMIENCPFADRCFTSFPCSSASAASFNRTLWHATGSAQIDEVRGMYNSQAPLANGNKLGGNGPVIGLHVRGPQLNPQVRILNAFIPVLCTHCSTSGHWPTQVAL